MKVHMSSLVGSIILSVARHDIVDLYYIRVSFSHFAVSLGLM